MLIRIKPVFPFPEYSAHGRFEMKIHTVSSGQATSCSYPGGTEDAFIQ